MSISKIRTTKAEFLGSFRALDILLPQKSALPVQILEIDTYVSREVVGKLTLEGPAVNRNFAIK